MGDSRQEYESQREYWARRAKRLNKMQKKAEADAQKEIREVYKEAKIEIKERLQKAYDTYGDDRDIIDPVQLKKGLTIQEKVKLRKRYDGYYEELEKAKLMATSGKSKEALDAQKIYLEKMSIKTMIQREEELLADVGQTITLLGAKTDEHIKANLIQAGASAHDYIRESITGSVKLKQDNEKNKRYKVHYASIDMSMQAKFGVPDFKAIERLVKTPWHGGNFSDRVWRDKGQLKKNLDHTLRAGFLRGDGSYDLADQLHARMDVDYRSCERIVRTEMSHVMNEQARDAYHEADITTYEVIVAYDERTCPVCKSKSKDDKGKTIFYGLDEAASKGETGGVTGESFPPFHPNCRCTTGADTSDLSWIDKITNEIYPDDDLNREEEKTLREMDMGRAAIVDPPVQKNNKSKHYKREEKQWEDAQENLEIRAAIIKANSAKNKRKSLQENRTFRSACDYSSDAYTFMNAVSRTDNSDRGIASAIVQSLNYETDTKIIKRFKLEQIFKDVKYLNKVEKEAYVEAAFTKNKKIKKRFKKSLRKVRSSVKHLEGTIDKCRMPKMTLLARGTGPDFGILGDEDSIINMMHVGQRVKSKGFLSLSYDKTKASHYSTGGNTREHLDRIMIFVDTPEGAHGLMMEELTTVEGEHEVLFNSGETFIVKSIGKGAIGNNKGQYMIVHLKMEKRDGKT